MKIGVNRKRCSEPAKVVLKNGMFTSLDVSTRICVRLGRHRVLEHGALVFNRPSSRGSLHLELIHYREHYYQSRERQSKKKHARNMVSIDMVVGYSVCIHKFEVVFFGYFCRNI